MTDKGIDGGIEYAMEAIRVCEDKIIVEGPEGSKQWVDLKKAWEYQLKKLLKIKTKTYNMKTQIKNDMVNAMKSKNEVARDILRVLRGEIQRNEQSSKGKIDLVDADIVKIIEKLVESVKESGDDNGEIAILEGYLPEQMTKDEIEVEAAGYITINKLDSPREKGRVMGHFKQNHEGTYDGKLLSNIVKQLLA